MPYVFISYSHKDSELARRIVQQMEAAGVQVWVDYQNIPPGADWEQQIAQGIRSCEALVLIQTPRSEVSPRVKKEWLYAEHLKRPIYPLLCEGDLWFSFVDVQFTDLRQAIDAPLVKLISTLPRSIPLDRINALTATKIGRKEERLKHETLLNKAVFSPSGQLLAAVGGHGFVGVWATEGIRKNAHTEYWFPSQFGYECKAVAFSPDERYVAVGTRHDDGAAGLKIYDIEAWRELIALRDSSHIAHVEFTPDGRHLVAVEGGLAPRILIYAVPQFYKVDYQLAVAIQPDTKGNIRDLAISPENSPFVTCGRVPKGVRLWSLGGEIFQDLEFDPVAIAIVAVAFSGDGKYLITAAANGNIWLWDRSTGERLEPPLSIGSPVRCIASNPYGDVLAVGLDLSEKLGNLRGLGLEQEGYAEIQLWNLNTRQQITSLLKHTNTVNSLNFSSDGKWLVSASADKRLHLWGLA